MEAEATNSQRAMVAAVWPPAKKKAGVLLKNAKRTHRVCPFYSKGKEKYIGSNLMASRLLVP